MKISCCEVIDELLDGGFETSVISTIYGPAASGKTNIAILLASKLSKEGKKVIWVDTEGSFSVDRFKQICPEDNFLDNLMFLKPTSFEEQHQIIQKLADHVTKEVGAIIVDTATMLYRTEIGMNDSREMNDKLVFQYRLLLEIARKQDIPVLCSSQVYSDLGDKEKYNVVGGTIVKNISQCLIELQKPNGERMAIVRKHRSIPENKSIKFIIVEQGIQKIS